jgi:hypothetical protein
METTMGKQVSRYESDGSTPAQASYDEGSVQDGASTTPRRIWWKNASTEGETLEGCKLQIEPVGENDGADYLQIAPDVPVEPPGQPSSALTTGIALEIGYYEHAITFVTANGETPAGTRRGITTTSGNQKVQLSSIPVGPSGVTKRRVYRTAVGGGAPKFVAEIPDNTTTTYLDQTPDASLGAAPPTLNTSGAPGTWTVSDITIGDLSVGAYAACWMRYSIPAGTSQVGNPRRGYVSFMETGA